VIVAPTWLLMSSPTIGTPASANFCAHGSVYGVATESTTGDEHVEVGNVAGSPNQIVARTTTGDVRVGYR